MARKSLRQFVRENRQTIQAAIDAAYPKNQVTNDAERAEFVENDEGLYLWALSQRVNV